MAPPRIFTLAEARALVPVLRPRLREMARIRERLLPFREQVERLAEGAQRGGGTFPAAGEYLRHVQELNGHLAFLRGSGVELKDVAAGLVDFPSMREGRVVCLCWRMEEETVSHWHEIEAGFAGRKPIRGPLEEPSGG
ncbi:MAG: hypothetical protein A3J27_06515 [Candidatus Tectomicrobia bacterium RIFCSPLOWO2_12_FULL_69_37]|nr:MAG: hypothetical protein A3I72_12395 [Candidatus Tectomicrobia bacterium RIFCSPLOWO2_02_FULL_70_19]OGL65863.1 MAG: hypothetical protein A3J27_06515 [Candidatus Tectomicrobia bacterium RIFCSPLOWO2_12_FULL_69_37]